MSLGPLMVDVEGMVLSPDDIDVLSHPLVGSVLLYTRNYRNPKQIAELCESIRALRSPHLLIATDHEGGRIQRFREGFTQLPAARLLGRRFDEDRSEGLRCAHAVGWLLAAELRAVGVDFSFAPCVDIDWGLSEVIGDRALHRDGEVVAALGAAWLSGMREAGMAAVAKHFPGHGAVRADSHVALPIDRRTLDDLETDIKPYRLLIENQLPGVMTAHVEYPAVDAMPASLSRRWVSEILRGSLGFHGCVFADDLSMAGVAAAGDVLTRARLALAAGCDVLPILNDRHAVRTVLASFKPDVALPASQARLMRMRARGLPSGELASDPRWRAAVRTVEELTAAPPLVLTEGQA